MNNSNNNSPGPILLLAVLAILIAWLATRYGIGLTPDSTVYLDAAHNLLNDRGLTALTGRGEFGPLTHYPPLYPAVLALLTRLGILFGGQSIEGTARVLNSFIFGANVLLVGVGIRSYARSSYWLPVIGSALTLTAPAIAGIHTFALTEGLFIFLSLGGLLSLSRFIETKKQPWLMTAAVMVTLAFLTRYVGITLILTGVLVLLFVQGRSLRQRGIAALSFGLVAGAPMALWTLRNLRLSAGVSDREFVFHPIGLRQIVSGVSTASTWLLLGKVGTNYRIVFFALELGLTIVIAIYLLRRNRPAPADKEISSPLVIILVTFVGCYVAFLIFTASFIDADSVLDDRALAPVHIA
ncbi:MAG TPA: glycosyltransferase family 39 protein, partial [Pyrinomonadaceae bacterium]|nr:glycosyltransferase family 39 protein [Pyrinomonadaceae bacterium]